MIDRVSAGAGPTTEPLQVEASVEGRSVCLALRGELTYGTVAVFDEQVAQVVGPGAGHPGPPLVVDVHGLQFCDSVGLSALIGAERRVELVGGRMVLRGVHGMLERVLRITGAGVLFTVAGGDPADRESGAAGGVDSASELA
jgi:anti-sigma B factor antagonist